MNIYDNKVVAITGGAGGIGRAAAALYLKEGAKVYIIGRTAVKLEKAVMELEDISNKIYSIQGDISEPADVDKIIGGIMEKEGKIDILVNSAGIYMEKPTLDFSISEWDNIIDINLKGTFLMCKAALPHLMDSKGIIVNVSSTAGLIGFKGVAAYCASKGGINMLTKALAAEFSQHGVRINAVCPDMVDTDMLQKDFESSEFKTREEYDEFNWTAFAQGGLSRRYITAQEVAKSILFLSSPDSEAITGHCLAMDFGLTSCI